jgi:SAM-dependent methyltransferase
VKYRREATRYDRPIRLTARSQRAAIERLELRPGETVLDIACGTGINLSALARRVGANGRVIGVDLSPDMLAIARARATGTGLANVTLVQSAIEDAELPGPTPPSSPLTHDVLQSPVALDNVIGRLHGGDRVATFGRKRPPSPTLLTDRIVRPSRGGT